MVVRDGLFRNLSRMVPAGYCSLGDQSEEMPSLLEPAGTTFMGIMGYRYWADI